MRADPIGLAIRLIDDVRDASAEYALDAGKRALPDLSFSGIEAKSAKGKALLARIEALDATALPEAIALTLGVARARVQLWAREADWYWTVFDPTGWGLYGMFAATPYTGGFAITAIGNALKLLPLAHEGDRYRYFAAIADFGRLIDQFADRTRGQSERGIFMPRTQAEAAIALLERLVADQPKALAVSNSRAPDQADFCSEVDDGVEENVVPALERLKGLFTAEYLSSAPEQVGLMHYPGGPEIYAELVRHHASTECSPKQVHDIGLERMAQIRVSMAAARKEAGFTGSDLEWRSALDADPEWRAEGDEALSRWFQRYIDRFAPYLDSLFSVRPKASHGVRPLPEALTAAMTFGYYDGPTDDKPHGDYVFNGHNLAQSALINLGALNYHELVPGHHLHLALQRENLALPVLRKDSLPTAYTEGWAEYAATLAGELGMYERPEERFGRLVSEAFLTARLVVDTGMNSLGWSLEQARDYMRENSFFPETEIRSETLRYSCDIPGQALAYKMGEFALADIRAHMRERLGDKFALRDFHDAVLGAGALPLPVLAERLDAMQSIS